MCAYLIQNSTPSFENSADSDHLASLAAVFHPHGIGPIKQKKKKKKNVRTFAFKLIGKDSYKSQFYAKYFCLTGPIY